MIFLHPRVFNWIFKRLGVDIHSFSLKSFALWCFSYAVVWIAGGAILFTIARAFFPIGLESLTYVIGSWTLVGVLSTFLFFLPTNFGFTEIGISLLLTAIMPSSYAVIVALITRVLILVYEILWALISWAIELRTHS